MLKRSKFLLILYLFLQANCINFGCQEGETPSVHKSEYKYIAPQYNLIQLRSGADTLDISLSDTTYNDIESMNYFLNNSVEYLSFFDKRSALLNIFSIDSGRIVATIPISKFLKKPSLSKTSVYVRNFDSILITEKTKLYFFDSTGKLYTSIPFLVKSTYIKSYLDISRPPIVVDQKLYTIVKPSGTINTIAECRKWKSLYEFDLSKNTASLNYNLPEVYHKNLYSFQYMYSNYCYNANKRFVFSFYADTNIYETDLAGYHIAYLGKSQHQNGNITPITKEDMKNDAGSKSYLTHHTYGVIFFDPYRHRYLRVSKQKVSEVDYIAKKTTRKQSIILLNENFKIIGESPIDANIDLTQLFFRKDGSIYARLNPNDEYALHFVRLQYSDQESPASISKK